MPAPRPDDASLCQQCGLCCNGVLFVDVKLQAGEHAAKFEKLGVPVSPARGKCAAAITQSCPALAGLLCRIYSERPAYCRAFDCAVLKRVRNGGLSEKTALKLIRSAHRKADQVKGLMRELGDTEESQALSVRFKALLRQVERRAFPLDQANKYAQLTTAMHSLNVLLITKFYPGDNHEK